MIMEPSPLPPLPLGKRGLRFGNLRKASALSFFVNGRSEVGVVESGDGGLGELGEISKDEIEGGSLGGNGGGFEYELNLKPLKRESDVDILVVVAVQPALIRLP